MKPKTSTLSLSEEAAVWQQLQQRNERLAVMAVLVVVRKRKIKECWFAMHKRCTNPKLEGFHRYGGRGIKICSEWARPKCMMNFVNWAFAHGFYTDLMLDRENNNGNYTPANCRWVTPKVSASNREITPATTANGKRQITAILVNKEFRAKLEAKLRKAVIASNGAVYPSNVAAGHALGMVDGSGIGKCLHGRIKTSGGLTWRYL